MYLWLKSYNTALKRVAKRVSEGGHFIPDEDVKRRYEGRIRNLVDLFIPVVNYWSVHDNSDYNSGTPKLIARNEKDGLITIAQQEIWTTIKSYGNKR